MGLNDIIASKKVKKLKESGVVVNAVVKSIERDLDVDLNGHNPKRLICEGTLPDGKTTGVFTSADLPQVPSDAVGKPITVYVDPKDSANYFVDVSEFEK